MSLQEYCKRGHKMSETRRRRANGHNYCHSCNLSLALKRNKKWQDAHKDKHALSQRKRHLKVNYGISVEKYDEMFKKQDGRCACCFERKYRLVVDHNHKTGEVRSLLCDNCNCTIGLIHEDKSILNKVLNYLEFHHV